MTILNIIEELILYAIAIVFSMTLVRRISDYFRSSRAQRDFRKYGVFEIHDKISIKDESLKSVYNKILNWFYLIDSELLDNEPYSYIKFKHRDVWLEEKGWEKILEFKLREEGVEENIISLETLVIPAPDYRKHPDRDNPMLFWPKLIFELYKYLGVEVDAKVKQGVYSKVFLDRYIDEKKHVARRYLFLTLSSFIIAMFGLFYSNKELSYFTTLYFLFLVCTLIFGLLWGNNYAVLNYTRDRYDEIFNVGG